MPVAAIKEYTATPRDLVENFNGKQIVYASWDRHLLFAAPFLLCVPPEMPFSELVTGPLSLLVQADPDAAAINWHRVEWLKANQPWTPDFDASLKANGISHKTQLRFRTPGLNSLSAAA